eukprot:7775123-Ditylum_brightwellii.AAC.1
MANVVIQCISLAKPIKELEEVTAKLEADVILHTGEVSDIDSCLEKKIGEVTQQLNKAIADVLSLQFDSEEKEE